MARVRKTADVLLFGSQGADAYMRSSPLSDLEKDIPAVKPDLERFLRRCFEAFQDEIRSLGVDERSILDDHVIEEFSKPEDLLLPPVAYQSNPVIESISFYLHQLVDLIVYLHQEQSGTVIEVGGICSGVLPAVLAALSPASVTSTFLDYAVDCFRLAFWVGIRTALFCRQQSKSEQNEPWCLYVRGCSTEQLQEIVEDYNTHSPQTPVRISVVLADDSISLVSDPQTLNDFKEHALPVTSFTRSPHVHGFFHGGPVMNKVCDQIVLDVQTRDISFPSWDLLRLPVRCFGDVDALCPKRPLLEEALKHLLIDSIDWRRSWTELNAGVQSRDSTSGVRVVLLGPNTGTLRSATRSSKTDPRVRIQTLAQLRTLSDVADGIAIVGMSANFPVGSDSIQIWDSLERGDSTVSEVPDDRFDLSQYYVPSASQATPRHMPVKYGNFLENSFDFDNEFFNISPREAKSIDPQQRLLLQASFEALENAGYVPDSTPTFQRESFGVYVGAATGDYVDNLRNDIDVYYSPGTLRAFLSGRISYAFGFQGPSMVVDTACSSSLVAIYHACRALQTGECHGAIAAGVNVISSPDMYLGLARAHFLSRTGQCKPFDEAADGYCRAEGVSAIVLKRMSDAVAEHDQILGVIKGVEINQCGLAKSITHPDHEAQAALFRKLLRKTKITPEMVTVVEAHGTGTQAGDQSEVNSLRTVFGHNRSGENPLYVSSIKGNMGHAEAASGLAGLTKLLLMMKHQKIPPQASLTRLNPRLGLQQDNCMEVPREILEWKCNGPSRRLALLNNFGAAGSNAALILEEPPVMKRLGSRTSGRSCNILNISAKSERALNHLRERYLSLLKEESTDLNISHLCYSANARREDYLPFRLSAIGESASGLSSRLKEAEISKHIKNGNANEAVFIFSGQGGNYPGMGSELLSTSTTFSTIVRRCDDILVDQGFPAVLPYISGEHGYEQSLDVRDQIAVSQCACFVLEYALGQLWVSWGVVPDLVVGHSLGEYAAFATANMMTMHEALLLVARRADLMARLCKYDTSGMIACRITPQALDDLLSAHPNLKDITIACYNGREDTVVSGPKSALDAFVEIARYNNVKATNVEVPFGYHSAAMDPMLDAFRQLLPALELSPSTCSVGSSLYGAIFPAGHTMTNDYFCNQTREPVEFHKMAQAIAECYPKTNVALIEIGPHPITIPKFKGLFVQDNAYNIASLNSREKPWISLSKALQTLFLRGHTIKWKLVHDGADARFVEYLPCYPLTSHTYVRPVEEIQSAEASAASTKSSSKDSRRVFLHGQSSKNINKNDFEADMSEISPFLNAHKVDGVPLCPASVYTELAYEVIGIVEESSRGVSFILKDLTFEHALVASHDLVATKLTAKLSQVPHTVNEPQYTFSIFSANNEHCAGVITSMSETKLNELVLRKTASVQRQMQGLMSQNTVSERLTARTIYRLLFPRVVSYSAPLETLQHLWISPSRLEAHGIFKLPDSGSDGRFVSHPALIDTLLHAPGFIANANANADTAYICAKVDTIVLSANTSTLFGQQLNLYCCLVDVGDSYVCDSYATTSSGQVVAWVEGISFKRLPLRSFKTYLSRISQTTNVQSKPTENRRLSLGKVATQKASKDPLHQDMGADNPNSSGPSLNLFSIIRQICGLEENVAISSQTSLETLGIDSLLSIELSKAIAQHLPQFNETEVDVQSCQTIGDLQRITTLHLQPTTNDPGQLPPMHEGPVTTLPSGIGGQNVRRHSDVPTDLYIPSPNPNASLQAKRRLSQDAPTPAGIGTLIEDIFGFPVGDEDSNSALSSLGIDSLGSIELDQELQHRYGISVLATSETISDLTLSELQDLVCGTRQANALDPVQPADVSNDNSKPLLVKFDQSSSNRNSLYMFHDGSGKCSMYSRLAIPGHNLFGIHNNDDAVADSGIATIEELATLYIEQNGLMNERNALKLGGWSFGGVLAFEVACQLTRRGREVSGVVLIDSPAPLHHEPLPEAVIRHLVDPSKSSAHRLIAQQFRKHAAMLQHYNLVLDAHESIPCVMIQCTRTFDTELLCGTLYPFLSSREGQHQNTKMWSKLLGGNLSVLDLDSDHFSVFQSSQIDKISHIVAQACSLLDNGAHSNGS